MRFTWYDRGACIRRIVVLISCTHMDMDAAINAAIHKADGQRFRYCNNPALITPTHREKLKKDAQAVYDAPEKLIAAGRMMKA